MNSSTCGFSQKPHSTMFPRFFCFALLWNWAMEYRNERLLKTTSYLFHVWRSFFCVQVFLVGKRKTIEEKVGYS